MDSLKINFLSDHQTASLTSLPYRADSVKYIKFLHDADRSIKSLTDENQQKTVSKLTKIAAILLTHHEELNGGDDTFPLKEKVILQEIMKECYQNLLPILRGRVEFEVSHETYVTHFADASPRAETPGLRNSANPSPANFYI